MPYFVSWIRDGKTSRFAHPHGDVNSALQFASFFTKATNFSAKELEELKKIVEQELKNKKK